MTISVSSFSPFNPPAADTPLEDSMFDPVAQYELLAARKSLQLRDCPKYVVVKLCNRVDLFGH
jgi:hypothetical protein